jgi:CRISPR-associated protein Csd1
MILQELYAYYNRMRETPDSGIALPGFSPQKISFALVIDAKGKLIDVQDLRDTSGKKPRPISRMVPEAVIRASGIVSNFLWDNTGYVLGLDEKGNPERTQLTFEAFKARQHEIGDAVDDPGMTAVLGFLDSWNPGKRSTDVVCDDVIGSNLVFRLTGEHRFVHERPAIVKAWLWNHVQASDATKAICLVTGKETVISALHAKIKGVRDAQTSGAALVSFNLDAFRSYGKEQNFNAPIGEEAAFAYTTALNHLLRSESRQRLHVGDATTVFWTERASPLEDFLGNMLDPRADAAVESADAKNVSDYLVAIRDGKKPEMIEDDTMRFFILGLSPNASRVAVRFWHSDTVEAVNRHIGRHFSDISLVKQYDRDSEFPSLWQLLISTATLGKSENINPTLAGPVMRSILEGFPYPASLLSTVLERIRVDHDISYYRAALIKGVLKRNFKNEEVTMALYEGATSVAYRLGRLFAVLEKAQEEAVPGANATIKDRFFGSASSTPSVVFPQLIRLSQHHLAKLGEGAKIHKEQLIQSILDGIDATKGFPAHLRLEDQGLFALGYYHQRKSFFTKKGEKQPIA